MNILIEVDFPTQGIRSEIPYQRSLRLHEEVETGNFSKLDENQETNMINLQLRLKSVVLWLDTCLKGNSLFIQN